MTPVERYMESLLPPGNRFTEPPAWHCYINPREFWRRRRASFRRLWLVCRDCAQEFQPDRLRVVRCTKCRGPKKGGAS